MFKKRTNKNENPKFDPSESVAASVHTQRNTKEPVKSGKKPKKSSLESDQVKAKSGEKRSKEIDRKMTTPKFDEFTMKKENLEKNDAPSSIDIDAQGKDVLTPQYVTAKDVVEFKLNFNRYEFRLVQRILYQDDRTKSQTFEQQVENFGMLQVRGLQSWFWVTSWFEKLFWASVLLTFFGCLILFIIRTSIQRKSDAHVVR